MFYPKSLVALVFICAPFSLLASEHEGAAKAEEKKEEAAPKENPQQEVMDLETKLSALRAKVNSKKETLKKLIEEKEQTHDEKHAYEIVTSMKAEYKELQQDTRDYEEKRALLNYRYPEKGLTKDRKYERVELKTLEEMESQFSVDGKVKKTLARVRQQYPDKARGKKADASAVEKPIAPAVKDPSRNAVTESQVLSK